jgi:hypothetical protein
MRRIGVALASIAGLLAAGAASAVPTPALDREAISAAPCTPAGSGARQIVDVSFTLTNYADAGCAGMWALDTVNRHLRIWRHGDGSYCAQVSDDGSRFVTVPGPSPVGNGYVTGGITGTFDGGYITTQITGKFTPRYPTHGKLGTFDAKCNRSFDCPGKRPSWLSYFTHPVANEFARWGWLYDAGPHGIWLDQVEVSPPDGGNIRG